MSTATFHEPRVSITYHGKRAAIRYFDIDGYYSDFHTDENGAGLYHGHYGFEITETERDSKFGKELLSPMQFWLGPVKRQHRKDILYTLNYGEYGVYRPYRAYGHIVERASRRSIDNNTDSFSGAWLSAV